MPPFLYRIHPTQLGMLTEGPTERKQRIIGEYFAYLQDLLSRGTQGPAK